jgi:hypothetical protein
LVMEKLDLVRDVLDKQLVDPDGEPLGRADGVIIELFDDGSAPQVRAIETGVPALARRLPRRLGIVMRWVARKIGPRGGRPYRIRWSRVISIDANVRVGLKANTSPTTASQRWARDHFTSHVPFSG